MKKQMKSKQRGISFIGLVFVASLIAMAGVVAAQVFPTVLEYQAILKATQRSAQAETPAEIRGVFDKASEIDDIKSISSKDLEITKEGEKVVVRFAYEREIALFGPAYLTLKYSGSSN